MSAATTPSVASHYLDLELAPDPEFAAQPLINALFMKLHRALVERRPQPDAGSDIGVSFPRHNATAGMGTLLRLHGNEQALRELMDGSWLAGMRDHLRALPPIRIAPADAPHRAVRRVQAHSNPERQRRRLRARHPELSEEEIMARCPDTASQRLRLPYLSIRSVSTGEHFRLYLEHRRSPPSGGTFNCYGLARGEDGATVPWF